MALVACLFCATLLQDWLHSCKTPLCFAVLSGMPIPWVRQGSLVCATAVEWLGTILENRREVKKERLSVLVSWHLVRRPGGHIGQRKGNQITGEVLVPIAFDSCVEDGKPKDAVCLKTLGQTTSAKLLTFKSQELNSPQQTGHSWQNSTNVGERPLLLLSNCNWVIASGPPALH